MSKTRAALNAIQAVADAIKELGEVPSGHLYASLIGVLNLGDYEAIIGILTRSGLVRKQGDLLTWSNAGSKP